MCRWRFFSLGIWWHKARENNLLVFRFFIKSIWSFLLKSAEKKNLPAQMTFRHTLTYPLCCCIDEQSGEPQALEGPERWTFRLCVFLQQSIYEELPEAVSSIFQIEQEGLLEWGAIGEENLAFTSQEALEIMPLEDFSKPLEAGRPSVDVKSGRRSTIKVSNNKTLLSVLGTRRIVQTGDVQLLRSTQTKVEVVSLGRKDRFSR